MQLDAAALSHRGWRRPGNEDSGYAGSSLLVVADGVGGAAAGEVASTTATLVATDLAPGDPWSGRRADPTTVLGSVVERTTALDLAGLPRNALLPLIECLRGAHLTLALEPRGHLIEGSLARAALVSDVEMVEQFPIRYRVERGRQHRWTRGDWQLLPFIVRRGNGLNMLSRFKMLDNLRRSLMAPAWVAAWALGWLSLPGQFAVLWQLGLIGLLALIF